MRNCQQCTHELPPGAQFCPECGAKQSLLVVTCTHCGKMNEEESAYCIYCGEMLKEEQLKSYNKDRIPHIYKAKYPLDFREIVRLPVQFRTYFLKVIKERLTLEGAEEHFDAFVNKFYDSSFLKTFDEAAKEMAEQCYLLHAGQSPNASREVDEYLTRKFEQFMDRFLVGEGLKIHNNSVAEDVLQQQEQSISNQQLGDMVLDYLSLNEEQEKWYADITDMPKLKLKNALEFFLHAEPAEKVILICDQTIFGSCREGFALTDKALYWKAHFNKAQQLYYKDIKTMELSKEWLVINGKFFNANPAINVKMMHLLKKLSGKQS